MISFSTYWRWRQETEIETRGSQFVMEENIEKVMQAVCAAEGQAAVLLVTDDEPATTEGPREVLTVFSLKFEPTLQSAAYSTWFEDSDV